VAGFLAQCNNVYALGLILEDIKDATAKDGNGIFRQAIKPRATTFISS